MKKGTQKAAKLIAQWMNNKGEVVINLFQLRYEEHDQTIRKT